tara:strand:+ start:58 stop:879 length:822 start_codon:yes stop_codon:yes gene_type:complete
MKKLLLENVGEGLIVFEVLIGSGVSSLYVTTKGFYVEETLDGECVLSRDQAVKLASFLGICSTHLEFDSLVQCAVSESKEYADRKAVDFQKRIEELQMSPALHHVLVFQDEDTDELTVELSDHLEIHQMVAENSSNLGHYGSCFSAHLPESNSRHLEGELIKKDDTRLKIQFWCDPNGDYTVDSIMSGRFPHCWISIEEGRIENQEKLRLVVQCAIKAMLIHQVKYESKYGRDPFNSGMLESPSNPEDVPYLAERPFEEATQGIRIETDKANS